jgi:hypothetical protein
MVITDDCIAGPVTMDNARQCLPVRFGENPRVDPGVVPKGTLFKANVEDLAQSFEHPQKP